MPRTPYVLKSLNRVCNSIGLYVSVAFLTNIMIIQGDTFESGDVEIMYACLQEALMAVTVTVFVCM